MVTPAQIMPEWYFLPFFTILRAVTIDIHVPFSSVVLISSTLGGAILMFGSVGVLLALPWLDRSPVRSALFRPVFRVFFWALVIDCLALGYIGTLPVEEPFVTIGQIATFYYFLHFLVILPLLAKYEKTKALPTSISDALNAKKVLSVLLPLAFLIGLTTSVQAEDVAAADGIQITEAQGVPYISEASGQLPVEESHKQTGTKVIVFFVALAGVMYLLKREIWKKLP